MELRVLAYFLAVARERNISSAARFLHISQPALSTQIKALEDELGKKLLIRGSPGSRQITLTEEGILLRRRAEEILSLVRKTENEIAVSDTALTGEITIGAGETDIIRRFAVAAKELQRQGADIRYNIYSGNAQSVLENLDSGLIDFGLLFTGYDAKKYEGFTLPVSDFWGVLMRRDSPYAEKERITPEDLYNVPLIVSRQRTDDTRISSWLKKDMAQLNIVATYNLVFNASLLVEEGLGYALCFDKLINTAERNLKFVPLSPPLKSEAYIIWKRYQVLSKAAENFLATLRQVFEKEKA